MSNIERRSSSPEKKGSKPQPQKISDETLSEQRLGDHLAVYGNHEGKAGILAAMKAGRLYTSGQLSALANPEKRKIRSDSSPSAWCRDSLEPNGLVARELADPKRRAVRYEKTKEGEELGEAFGGHLLDLSEDLPVSLYQLSGNTNSPSKVHEKGEEGQSEAKNRAPLTRFRIAETLLAAELPIREVDLAASLQAHYPESYKNDIHVGVGKHLLNLAESGVITFRSIKPDTDISFYRANSTRPDGYSTVFNSSFSLTHRVDQLLYQAKKSLSAQDIYAALVQEYPDYRDNKEDVLTDQISSILAHLAREGYANHEGFSEDVKSIITLTPSQRKTLGTSVDLGKKFQSLDQDFLTEGQEKARAIVADQERFTALMEKAYNASKQTNLTDQAETGTKIISYVRDNPGATNRDIQTYLQEGGQKLSTTRIGQITKALHDDGELIGNKKKHSMRYSVPEKSQSAQEG